MGKVILQLTSVEEDYRDELIESTEYFVVENNAFLDFLLEPENELFLNVVKESLFFTSDKWLTLPCPKDELGYLLTVDLLNEIPKDDEEAFIKLLMDNHVAYDNETYTDGFIIDIRPLTDSEELHVSTVINQYHKSTSHYSQLIKYFSHVK